MTKIKNEKNNPYHLFLDDNRIPTDVKWTIIPTLDWVIVRDYKQFIKIIVDNGLPLTISFDHDLADEHYKAYLSGKPIKYENFKEKTGYDCAKWLANYCVDNNLPIPVYYVHTLNPIGETNIKSILENARKVING